MHAVKLQLFFDIIRLSAQSFTSLIADLCFSFVREHCLFVNEINCSLFGNKMMTNNYSSKNGFLGQNLVILEVLLGFIVKEI